MVRSGWRRGPATPREAVARADLLFIRYVWAFELTGALPRRAEGYEHAACSTR
ncbi:hypothetical protein [Nocardia nova]|uniref:hypothetical protein n=1 Tax=Nocardia nova TaxID=37330 RepID=UPI0004AF66A0|nr:hypothetical protein [Nocardia nova]